MEKKHRKIKSSRNRDRVVLKEKRLEQKFAREHQRCYLRKRRKVETFGEIERCEKSKIH